MSGLRVTVSQNVKMMIIIIFRRRNIWCSSWWCHVSLYFLFAYLALVSHTMMWSFMIRIMNTSGILWWWRWKWWGLEYFGCFHKTRRRGVHIFLTHVSSFFLMLCCLFILLIIVTWIPLSWCWLWYDVLYYSNLSGLFELSSHWMLS